MRIIQSPWLLILAAIIGLTGCFDQQAKIIQDNSCATYDKYMGFGLALDGNYGIAGIPDGYNCYVQKTGATYHFQRGNGDWVTNPNRSAPSFLNNNDFFGYSVAINGNYAITGSLHEDNNAGAAYIYQRFTSIGNDNLWYQQARLIASDRASGDYFGSSVAIYGDYAVVGASNDSNARGSSAGAVYIFKRSGSSWTQQAKLIASDGSKSDYFGVATAIDGNHLVVGASYDDTAKGSDAGSAYVFERVNNNWIERSKLGASGGAAGDLFGNSVSIHGDLILVGAHYNDNSKGNNAGAAYLFEKSGNQWTQEDKLLASDGNGGDKFGHSVAIDADYAIVGAPNNDNANGDNAGAAYVYWLVGDSLYSIEKLTSSDGAGHDYFGFRVALSGKYAALGALYDDNSNGPDAGAVYLFEACTNLMGC